MATAAVEVAELHRIATAPAVARARAALRETDAETMGDMRAAVAIAAPPFGEDRRAAWVASRFENAGVRNVAADEAGNVIAPLGVAVGGHPVIVAAHLDTVFPAGTDLTLRERDGRLCAPGIADNVRGLATLIALARVAAVSRLRTRQPVILAATVGEEGVGDLRGVKHMFRPGSDWLDAAAFIAIDGTGLRRIVHRAIGSRRLRIVLAGPGGHSWADRGTVNPIHVLGAAIGEMGGLIAPRRRDATVSVGRIGGGTSVNAIPGEAWLEADLRADRPAELGRLEQRVRDIVERAADAARERAGENGAGLTVRIDLIGDRPSGETPPDAPLVRAARAATRFVGEKPELTASSTDANVPIAAGIPAIAMGAGGNSGGTHTPDEWYVNEAGPEGIERALLTLLLAAGLA